MEIQISAGMASLLKGSSETCIYLQEILKKQSYKHNCPVVSNYITRIYLSLRLCAAVSAIINNIREGFAEEIPKAESPFLLK